MCMHAYVYAANMHSPIQTHTDIYRIHNYCYLYIQYIDVTKAYMKSILLLLGANDTADLDTVIENIYELESNLANVSVLVTEFNHYYKMHLNNYVCV